MYIIYINIKYNIQGDLQIMLTPFSLVIKNLIFTIFKYTYKDHNFKFLIFCTTKGVFCDYAKLCFSNENLSFYTINYFANNIYEQFDILKSTFEQVVSELLNFVLYY